MLSATRSKVLLILPVVLAVCLPISALAVPALQLDIEGGWYNWETETINIGQLEPFTLYAVLTEKNQASIDDMYYLSVAVISSDGNGIPVNDPSIGSFYIDTDTSDGTGNGSVISATGDMTYGVPPLEEVVGLQDRDPGDLQTHGIFPTYFAEYSFIFDPTQTTSTYNAGYDKEDTADPALTGGTGGGLVPGGEGSYYYAFHIDAGNIPTEYNLHFDLYSTQYRETRRIAGSDIDRDLFAPFSHDAQTVPEPDILLLFGSGMFLVGIFVKRSRKKNSREFTA